MSMYVCFYECVHLCVHLCVSRCVFVCVCIGGKLEDLANETKLQMQSKVISMLGLRLVTTLPLGQLSLASRYFKETFEGCHDDLQIFWWSMMDNHKDAIERYELSCAFRGNFYNGVERTILLL